MVTVDESWVSHFMPETKVQSKEWSEIGAKPPRKAKRTESQKKLMYVITILRVVTASYDLNGFQVRSLLRLEGPDLPALRPQGELTGALALPPLGPPV